MRKSLSCFGQFLLSLLANLERQSLENAKKRPVMYVFPTRTCVGFELKPPAVPVENRMIARQTPRFLHVFRGKTNRRSRLELVCRISHDLGKAWGPPTVSDLAVGLAFAKNQIRFFAIISCN